MTMYTPGNCPVCGIPPLLFVRNCLDRRIVLYCFDCGGLYTAPQGNDLACGNASYVIANFRPAALGEIELAGFGKAAREVQWFARFP